MRFQPILIAYQGAMHSTATRSQDEARALAEDLRVRAEAGEDFDTLVRAYSDGSDISYFGDAEMAIIFSDHVRLKPGEVGQITQTVGGYVLVRRIK